ncbi:hypothetical protein GCM10017744_065080 [Streptomyces antimycoticus]|uniref:Integral membrane protein n=1 Tax=Streptomyces antimycoticus TaxID=68175 RepID=A0A4D4K3U7_9ACTN|nr:hypothetical protein [Streptomyces antimycoticus]GDY42814.1 hypothetical protein SANT12839_036960 [Streptomyces antimycoticus]
MIEWRRLSTGIRPVPDPVATPVIWGGAFLGALVLVVTLNFLGGHGRPMFALIGLSLLAALLGLCARFVAAPGTAALCWLFLNGFAIPPAGHLSWAVDRDARWLACLLVAAVAGTALARVVNARAGYRRVSPLGRRPGPPD